MTNTRRTAVAGWACCMLLAAGAADSRELAVDPADMVPVELATVGVNPMLGAPVVLLRDFESGDVVPIFIGVPEASAILMAMREIEVPRPMTHDLMASILSSTDMTLKRVMVDDLAEGTYFGMLELELPDREQTILVDSRPSDALALAVRTGAPILVAPQVLIAGRDLDYEGLESDQVVSALGVTVVEAADDYREALGLPDEPGLLVWRSTGRAAREGLVPGSLILTINGEVPEVPMDFLELIRATAAGQEVSITYWRDGETREVSLPPDLVAPRQEPGIGV